MDCHKTSNNKYFNCPPRMDDGRHFTDYRPSCHVNNLVRSNNAVLNSHEYRMFLTHNANFNFSFFIFLDKKFGISIISSTITPKLKMCIFCLFGTI